MYPELILWWNTYIVDHNTPIWGIILFIVLLYYITKSNWLRFRDISWKIPLIVIMTLIMWSYVNFVLNAWYIFPISTAQWWSLFSLSVDTLDFIGILLWCFIATTIAFHQMPQKIRNEWLYVLVLTYISLLIPLGVLYTLWDSVVGKFNDGFFSIGSFVSQSRIAQLWWSVYPIGLLISARSSFCIMILRYGRYRWIARIAYLVCAVFLVWYLWILHYQHYPRHLIVSIAWFQADIRSYLCIAIACIALYFGYTANVVHRFSQIIHEDSVWKTG